MAHHSVQLVVIGLHPPEGDRQTEQHDQDGQEYRRDHPAPAEQQPQQRLEVPLGHRSTSQRMKAETTISPAYCEAITRPAGTWPPTRTTVAAGTSRPATRTSFTRGTHR